MLSDDATGAVSDDCVVVVVGPLEELDICLLFSSPMDALALVGLISSILCVDR